VFIYVDCSDDVIGRFDLPFEQGDQIGRFFANWATFQSGWRFFEEKNSPKKWRFFGRILGLSKIAQNLLYKSYNLGPKKPFFDFFHDKFQNFVSILNDKNFKNVSRSISY
jgi:hypothetical protein